MPAQWLETREIPVGELSRFPGNARRGNVAEIRKSIMSNGQYRAIVVQKCDDGTLVILAGNHTYDAMCNLIARPPTLEDLLHGVHPDLLVAQTATATALLEQIARGTVRGEIITCTPAEARKINLADNRISDLAVDDNDALIELLSYLDGDYEGTGFNQDDVDFLLSAGVAELDGDNDVDGAAEDLEKSGWPLIRVQVPTEVRDRWKALFDGAGEGLEDYERAAAIISLAEQAKSGPDD